MFLADDIAAACIKCMATGSSLRASIRVHCKNTYAIWGGLFRGPFDLVLSRFTWEIIQTVAGLFIAHIANLSRNVSAVRHYHGCTVLEGGGMGGSLCLGTYILLSRGYTDPEALLMHEFGHALQSRVSGPLYLLKYGVSSILANRTSWVEADANFRSSVYFKGFNYRPLGRKMATRACDPKWWEYLLFLMVAGIILIPVLNFREGK